MRLPISAAVVTSARMTLVSIGSRSTTQNMDLAPTLSMSSLLIRGPTGGKPILCRRSSLLKKSTGSILAQTAAASSTATLRELRLPRRRQRLSLQHHRALPRRQRRLRQVLPHERPRHLPQPHVQLQRQLPLLQPPCRLLTGNVEVRV